MLQRLGEHISACLERARPAEGTAFYSEKGRMAGSAETKAANAIDAGIKADYEAIALSWRTLANSFTFCESLERFLLDADRRRSERIDAPLDAPLLSCPNCTKIMRIKTIDVSWGREQITLLCDQCGGEATRDT